jgi:hypothetical protein
MHVLFLAYGATRRRAAVEESAQVVADGGRAIVVIDRVRPWIRESFAPGVEVMEMSRLELRHRPRVLGDLVLYKGPRFLLYRVIGWGRLRRQAHRLGGAYERWVADRLQRRLLAPLYARWWRWARPGTIARLAFTGAGIDLLVVSDPQSMPEAARILATYRGRSDIPWVAYSLDHVAAGLPGQAYEDHV